MGGSLSPRYSIAGAPHGREVLSEAYRRAPPKAAGSNPALPSSGFCRSIAKVPGWICDILPGTTPQPPRPDYDFCLGDCHGPAALAMTVMKEGCEMMLYRVVNAWIQNDGRVKEGKRKQMYQTSQRLDVGGLYFLQPGKLYRVVEELDTGRDE